MRADHRWSKSQMGAQMMFSVARVGALAIIAGAGQVYAAADDDECKGPSQDCVAVGQWNFSVGLGAGIRTNPLVGGKDIPLVVVPQLSYYGKRFFIDNLDFGFTVAEHGGNTFSLIATPGYDRVYFYRTDLQNFFIGFPNVFEPSRPAPKSRLPRRALPIWPARNGPSNTARCQVNSISFAMRPARTAARRYAGRWGCPS
jgi:outer membrane protein